MKKVSPTCSVFFTPNGSKLERFSLRTFSAFLRNETRQKFVQDLYKKTQSYWVVILHIFKHSSNKIVCFSLLVFSTLFLSIQGWRAVLWNFLYPAAISYHVFHWQRLLYCFQEYKVGALYKTNQSRCHPLQCLLYLLVVG